MNKESKNKAAAEVFAANPEAKVLFQTEDGQCFIHEQHAGVHAAALGGKVSDYDEVARPSEKSEIKPAEKTGVEPEVKPAEKTGVEPEVKPAEKTGVK